MHLFAAASDSCRAASLTQLEVSDAEWGEFRGETRPVTGLGALEGDDEAVNKHCPEEDWRARSFRARHEISPHAKLAIAAIAGGGEEKPFEGQREEMAALM